MMAEYAEALILVWNGESPGSANMLKEAISRGLVVFEKRVPPGLRTATRP